MHQDIQNFLQIMDIDTNNKLVISYELKTHRNVNYEFYINNNIIKNNIGEIFLNLNELVNFTIKNISGDGAIEIIKITANGLELLPKYLNKSNPPTNWIENLNDWSFTMNKPFYVYIQEITGQGDIF